MLADFVKHMEDKGYLENTAVVITGDHLTMPNDVHDVIDQEENHISSYKVSDLDDKLCGHLDLYNVFWDIEPSGSN
jgi:phosphoglycerol transferase MdoB-like AlkP superfamily enzyme